MWWWSLCRMVVSLTSTSEIETLRYLAGLQFVQSTVSAPPPCGIRWRGLRDLRSDALIEFK